MWSFTERAQRIQVDSIMALLKYFKKSKKKSSVLPNPDGPLSDLV